MQGTEIWLKYYRKFWSVLHLIGPVRNGHDRHPCETASLLIMALPEVPIIISAERLNKGIVIRFMDGHCGFYSATLLFAKFAECEKLDEAEIEW